MIKANELRIGNFAIYLDGGIYKITNGAQIDDLSWQPIPLTEEWLIKFGFEFDGASYISPFSKKEFYRLRLHVMDYGIVYCINIQNEITICTVHQLQNLYFALTGQELTIKE